MAAKKQLPKTKQYGIYSVTEDYHPNGLWKGYTVAATASVGKQGKLYPRTDGRENYRAEPKKEEKGSSDDLEI